MEKDKLKRFDEVQPNSGTREELLVIMQYLQNYAYDKEHATTQTEIMDYAKEKYGLIMRRDRVGSILIHLEQISKQNPDLLPFVLKSVELKTIKKYYVPQKLMSDDDVAKICSIIIGDKKLSAVETKRLLEAFTTVNTTKNQKKELFNKITVRSGKRKKVSDSSYEAYEQFNRLCERKEIVQFRLKDPYLAEYSKKVDKKVLDSFKGITDGYPAFTYEIGGYTKYVIYVKKYKLGIITSIENLEFIPGPESPYDKVDKKVTYELDVRGEDKSIEKWVDAHYKGIDGIVHHFKLKTYVSEKGHKESKSFIEFKEKYKEYWSKPLKYDLVEREVEVPHYDGHIEKVVVYDAVFELYANISSFENWYLRLGNFDQVIILEPKLLNDFYLSEKVERYARRITKYGKKYNYTVTREYKPEYLEQREEIRKRIQERRKNRGEVLEEGKDKPSK